MAGFLDVELEVIERLRAGLATDWPTATVGTVTPNDLEGRDFVRVMVTGGSDDGLNDWASVDVEAFGPDRGRARDLAEACRGIMHSMAGIDPTGDDHLVDTVATTSRSVWVDYGNPRVQRIAAVYAVTSRIQ